MTIQLSKAQIEAIRVELAKVGLNVTVKRPSKRAVAAAANSELEARIASVEAWKPETSAGRACKSNMLRWLTTPKSTQPNSTAAVLAMFGVRLGDVSPWSGKRHEMLANGVGKGALALTYERLASDKIVYADAAAPVRVIRCL